VAGRRDDPVMVYSTERGLVCPKCRLPMAGCRCGKEEPAPAGDGIVRVRRETKGRGGKTVTAKDGVIEIQGDHRETIVAELSRRGFTAKLAGG
jgi:translation initiation factor 1